MNAKAFAIILSGFLSGVAIGYFWSPDMRYLLALSCGLVLAALFRKKWWLMAVAMTVLAFCLGVYRVGDFLWQKSQGSGPGPIFNGVVYRIDRNPYYRSQTLTVRPDGDRCLVRVRTKAFPSYRVGDNLKVVGASQELGERRSLKDNLCYETAYPEISVLEKKVAAPMSPLGFDEFIFAVRERLLGQIKKIYPEPYAALVAGILLGDKSGFSPELLDAFSRCGLTHILAVSGYNVVILASVLGRLSSFASKKSAFLLMVSGIWGFVFLTGASASAVRAGFMASVLLIARFSGREYYPLTSIVFTAAAMVLINPLVLGYDLGFQLSFLAVLGIVYFGPVLSRAFNGTGILAETITTTLAAQLLVMPFLVYSFGTVSTVSPLVNLLVLPFVPAAMLLSAVSIPFAILGQGLGQSAGYLAYLLLEGILKAVEYFAGLPWAAVDFKLQTWLMAVLYFLIIDFKIWSLRHAEKKDPGLFDARLA